MLHVCRVSWSRSCRCLYISYGVSRYGSGELFPYRVVARSTEMSYIAGYALAELRCRIHFVMVLNCLFSIVQYYRRLCCNFVYLTLQTSTGSRDKSETDNLGRSQSWRLSVGINHKPEYCIYSSFHNYLKWVADFHTQPSSILPFFNCDWLRLRKDELFLQVCGYRRDRTIWPITRLAWFTSDLEPWSCKRNF